MYLFLGIIISVIIISASIFYYFNNKSNISEKALALAAMGNFLDAKAMVRNLLEVEPNNTRLLFLMSKIYGMEKDNLSEAEYLTKIKKIGHYESDFPPVYVSNRIAEIYYQKDKYHEAFFHYLDTLKADPQNIEAIIRLSFMAIGQKEFIIAEKYMNMIEDEKIKSSSFFIARGVVAAMLDRVDEFMFFERAYHLDKNSITAIFLFAMANFRLKNYQEALDLVKPIVDLVNDDFIRFTIHQFLMIQYSLLGDPISAMQNARICIEIAKQNNWTFETSESELYYSMYAIEADKIEEASEYLIEAESLSINDTEIIDLANYKYILEEGENALGENVVKEYDLKSILSQLPDRLFSKDRYYELSGLRSNDYINIRAIVNERGEKILSELNTQGIDKVTRFLNLKGNSFKNICTKIINELGFKILREIPCLEAEGANFIATSRDDEEQTFLFKVRKWKNSKVSDVFLNEMLSNNAEQGTVCAYLVGFYELTAGARKVYKQNHSKIKLVTDKELEYLINRLLK